MAHRARIQIRPTLPGVVWLIAASALATIALVKNINLILLMSYFLVGLVAWNYFHCRQAVRRIRITRMPAQPSFARDEIPCAYEIENRSAHSVGQLVIEDAPFSNPHAWPIPALAGQSQCVVTRLAAGGRRGRYQSMPAAVTCSAPFGLVRARVAAGKSPVDWVYPGRGSIDLDRLRLRLPAMGIGRERRRALVPLPAEGTDIHGLRPFRTGDSPRLIHWKTTARVGEPMVREFDRNAAPDLMVVLDVDWLAADATGQRMEAALEFIATLVWSWSTKTEATLTVALPDAAGIAQHKVSQRAEAHLLLQHLCTYALPRTAGRSTVSYDAASDRIPVLVIGTTEMAARRGLTVDPLKACEFYRPYLWRDA